MIPPTLPVREALRLATLHSYEVLDTLPEDSLDDLTKLAAHICGVPAALISLIDKDRQWFKSRVGLDCTEPPLDLSFCVHALHNPGLFIVPDATKDARFSGNPLVLQQPHIRFYAGAPLISPEGAALGTLCVIDHRPRELTGEQEEALRVLGRQVMIQLETRRQNRELIASEAERANILASAMDAIIVMDGPGIIREFNPAAERMFGWTAESVIGQALAEVIIPPRMASAAPGRTGPSFAERGWAGGRTAHGNDGAPGGRRFVSGRVERGAQLRQRAAHVHRFPARHLGASGSGNRAAGK